MLPSAFFKDWLQLTVFHVVDSGKKQMHIQLIHHLHNFAPLIIFSAFSYPKSLVLGVSLNGNSFTLLIKCIVLCTIHSIHYTLLERQRPIKARNQSMGAARPMYPQAVEKFWKALNSTNPHHLLWVQYHVGMVLMTLPQINYSFTHSVLMPFWTCLLLTYHWTTWKN